MDKQVGIYAWEAEYVYSNANAAGMPAEQQHVSRFLPLCATAFSFWLQFLRDDRHKDVNIQGQHAPQPARVQLGLMSDVVGQNIGNVHPVQGPAVHHQHM